MKPKLPLLAVISGAVLALLAVVGASDTVSADFNPEYEITIVDPQGGAHSDVILDFSILKGDVQFGAAVFFIPGDWEITPGEDIPIGAVSGSLTATATLGIINGACDNVLPVEFIMLNASIDPTDTVVYLDDDDNGDPDYFEDKDGNGLQDGFEKYPDFIARVLVDEDDQPLTPIRRVAGITIIAGVEVLLQFLVFEPGTFIDEEIPNDPELGYPSVTLLQNVGDPEAEPIPSAITDFCSPLLTVITTYGVTRDNACTDTSAERLDPLCSVSSVILLECDDLRDSDGDQTVNDGCPTVGDEAETACDDAVDDDGDGWVNDGCPAVDEPENSTPTEPDEGGFTLSSNPAEGSYTYTLIAAGQRDADGDGYENALDTCPLVISEGDPRVKGDGDFDGDGLDAACDPNDDDINSDEDLDGYTNRQDNCPLIANGELEEDIANVGNQTDSDDDAIGDACDPNPENPDTEGALVFSTTAQTVAIGPGGEPAEDGTDADGDGDGDGDGGSATIIIVVIAAVAVLGGGAFFLMRRRST